MLERKFADLFYVIFFRLVQLPNCGQCRGN